MLLAGASGSGKSTFLAAVAGLLSGGAGESEGMLRVDGRDPFVSRPDAGFLMQDPETQLVMARAGDELAFPLEERCVPRAELWERVDRALADSDLGIARDHPTDVLSGGEQQRLALAASLITEPSLLLLDEPAANIDEAAASLLRARLARAGGRTLVLVDHQVDDAPALVDRVVAIAGPRGVIADGTPAEVFGRGREMLEAEGIWVPGATVLERRGAPGEAVLLARGVSFRHAGASEDALAPTDLTLRAGEAVAITGPNGAGKSTLALLLGGLLRPTRGDVVLAASAPTGQRHLWRLPAGTLIRHVGSVFQDASHQFVRGSVADELALGPRRAGATRQDALARAMELLDRVGLAQLARANPFTLSGGEQRRLSVATALATRPRLLSLDEPSHGLDRRGHDALVDLLDEHRHAGGALCFATHDRRLVRAVADREQRVGAA